MHHLVEKERVNYNMKNVFSEEEEMDLCPLES